MLRARHRLDRVLPDRRHRRVHRRGRRVLPAADRRPSAAPARGRDAGGRIRHQRSRSPCCSPSCWSTWRSRVRHGRTSPTSPARSSSRRRSASPSALAGGGVAGARPEPDHPARRPASGLRRGRGRVPLRPGPDRWARAASWRPTSRGSWWATGRCAPIGSIITFHDTATWLCQIVLFTLLGLPGDALAHPAAAAAGRAHRRVPDRRRPAGRRVRRRLLPFRFSPARDGLRLLGRPARRRQHLPRHHPGAGRAAQRAGLSSTSPSSSWSCRSSCRAGPSRAAARLTAWRAASTAPEMQRIDIDLPGQLDAELVGYPVLQKQPRRPPPRPAVLGEAGARGARRQDLRALGGRRRRCRATTATSSRRHGGSSRLDRFFAVDGSAVAWTRHAGVPLRRPPQRRRRSPTSTASRRTQDESGEDASRTSSPTASTARRRRATASTLGDALLIAHNVRDEKVTLGRAAAGGGARRRRAGRQGPGPRPQVRAEEPGPPAAFAAAREGVAKGLAVTVGAAIL